MTVHTRWLLALVGLTFAMLSIGSSAAQQTLPPDLNWILGQVAQFAPDQLAAFQTGSVISQTEASPQDLEAAAVAAVRIATPKARAADYYRSLITYVDGSVTLQFGTFSNPPKAADVAALTLESDDISDLKACQPGRCDVRIGGAGLADIRTAVDWSAPDAADRVNAWARQRIVSYVASYLEQGDAALVSYDDAAKPIGLREQWRGIVANSRALAAYAPALQAYLTGFPRASLPGARSEIYWDKVRYTGLKPVNSVTQLITWVDPQRTDRIAVVQKQIYASHYYYGSLAVALFFDDLHDPARPACYVVYANRSRGDLLKGGFGGLKQRLAEMTVKKAAEDTLGQMKRALEQ